MDVNADYMRAFKRVNPVELINFGIFDRPRGIAIDGQDRIASVTAAAAASRSTTRTSTTRCHSSTHN